MSRSFPGVDNNELTTGGDPAHLDTGIPMTLCAWIVRQGTGGYIIAKDSGAGGTRAYHMHCAGNRIDGRIEGPSGTEVVNGVTSQPANTWTHFAMRKSGTGAGSLAVFYNGVLDGSYASANTTINDSYAPLDVGNRIASTPAPHYGLIAEVAVWAAALVDAEIAALGKGVCPIKVRRISLRGYWPLFGLNLAAEADLSGWVTSLLQNGSVPQGASHSPSGPLATFASG